MHAWHGSGRVLKNEMYAALNQKAALVLLHNCWTLELSEIQ